jgi:WD40 repeat protein
MLYNAFISYSHAADGKLAPALQSGLEKFAKPWYKIRNLNIFRDESSLTATPHLWPNIQKALNESEYLIYMASPVSASSHWVSKEIEYWVATKSIDKLLIVLTEGEIPWDNATNNFLNADANSLPVILDKKFTAEPFYIDLRTARTQKDLSLNNPIFKKEILKLAAQLHNKEPKDLAGEEVAAHNKMIRIRNAAIGILAFLFIAAIAAAWIAIKNAKEAVKEKNVAQANYLASEAQRAADQDPTLALRLAEASMLKSDNPFIANIAQTIYRKNSFYKIIATLPKPDKGFNAFTAADFSPDGKLILTGSEDGIPRLWEPNGKLIREFKKHSRFVACVGFSRDGKSVLTQADSTIRMWDLNGNLVREIIDHSGIVAQAQVGPIMTNYETYIAPVTRFVQTYGKFSQQFSGNIFSHTMVAFAPDGKTIVSYELISNDITVSDSSGKITHTFPAHTKTLTSIEVSPDGKNILTASVDSTARLWDLKGKLLTEFKGHSAMVNDATFSPDGNLVLTAGQDGTCKLWSRNGMLVQDFKGDFYGAYCVDFSPDGKSLVTCCYRTLRLWTITKAPAREFFHPKHVLSVAFSPDGRAILSGCSDYNARLWDTSGKLLCQFKEQRSIIVAVAFSPDGQSILTGSWDGTICLYKKDGALLHKFKDIDGIVSSVAFSPDGKFILGGSDDSTARLWAINGNIIREFKQPGPVSATTFSPDGKFILVGGTGFVPRMTDMEGKLITEFGQSKYCSSLAISPDGKWVATGGTGDFGAQVWSMDKKINRDLIGHTSGVVSVAFSPDSKSLLTGSKDNTIKWWTLTGEMIQEFSGFNGDVMGVTFSADGKFILGAMSDNTARLWKADMPLNEFLKDDQIDPLTTEQKKKFGIE